MKWIPSILACIFLIAMHNGAFYNTTFEKRVRYSPDIGEQLPVQYTSQYMYLKYYNWKNYYDSASAEERKRFFGSLVDMEKVRVLRDMRLANKNAEQ